MYLYLYFYCVVLSNFVFKVIHQEGKFMSLNES